MGIWMVFVCSRLRWRQSEAFRFNTFVFLPSRFFGLDWKTFVYKGKGAHKRFPEVSSEIYT